MQVISSSAMKNYLSTIRSANPFSAIVYGNHVKAFEAFTLSKYNLNLDDLLVSVKEGKFNIYGVLSDFAFFLQNEYQNKLSTNTLRIRVRVVKNFLEYCDVDISDAKFRLKVRLPKGVRNNKEAIDKDDIRDILNSCSDIRLKTFVMLLAGSGCRSVEALSIRNKDLDLSSSPAKVNLRAEYTKTKQDRSVFLTKEMVIQLRRWLDFKYRKHRSCYSGKDGSYRTEYITPKPQLDDLVFAVYGKPNPRTLYVEVAIMYARMLDRIGKGDREDNQRRRKITLHSFRRFTKSTISDLGYSDYSEWFIGHSGSTYWRKKISEKAELFRKIEPYLTFLDYSELEAKGADIETKVEELKKEKQALKERYDSDITLLKGAIYDMQQLLKDPEKLAEIAKLSKRKVV
jgi:integrase